MSYDKRTQAHTELGDDLWEMWERIYFVVIGNRELQRREFEHGNNRITGPYGAKPWDDVGVACVVRSSLKGTLAQQDWQRARTVLKRLTQAEVFPLLIQLDCYHPTDKETLLTATGMDLDELLLFLVENHIVEYFSSTDQAIYGYKRTACRSIIVYLLMAAAHLLTQTHYSTSAYLPA